MNVAVREREIYSGMWDVAAYRERSPGSLLVDVFEAMARPTRGDAVLDAGCGTGLGAVALAERGYDVTMCDIVPDGLREEAFGIPFREACLWDDLSSRVPEVDWVYCCDVMEHVPLPFTMLVVRRLLERARRGVFLNIALTPESYGFFIGEPGLHVSLQPFEAWRDQLNVVGHVRECRDMIQNGVYLVEKRLDESDMLAQSETDTYERMWEIKHYGTVTGVSYEPILRDLEPGTLLDVGAGTGRVSVLMAELGHRVTLCDLTRRGLDPEARDLPFFRAAVWQDLRRRAGVHDWVLCFDVMEHVPPPFAMLAVSRLVDVARRGVVLSAALVPDKLGVWVGKRLHVHLQPFKDWRDQISTVSDLREARDMLVAGVFTLGGGAQ